MFIRPALQGSPIATFVLRAEIRPVACSSLWVVPDEERCRISFAHQFFPQKLNAIINSTPPFLAQFVFNVSMYVQPHDILIHISAIDEKGMLGRTRQDN